MCYTTDLVPSTHVRTTRGKDVTLFLLNLGVRSSVVEHHTDNVVVEGSIPSAPTADWLP